MKLEVKAIRVREVLEKWRKEHETAIKGNERGKFIRGTTQGT